MAFLVNGEHYAVIRHTSKDSGGDVRPHLGPRLEVAQRGPTIAPRGTQPRAATRSL